MKHSVEFPQLNIVQAQTIAFVLNKTHFTKREHLLNRAINTLHRRKQVFYGCTNKFVAAIIARKNWTDLTDGRTWADIIPARTMARLTVSRTTKASTSLIYCSVLKASPLLLTQLGLHCCISVWHAGTWLYRLSGGYRHDRSTTWHHNTWKSISEKISQAAQSRCTVVRPIQKSIGKWEIWPPVKS